MPLTFTPPKQDRSRQTTDSFLDALEQCLNEAGMTRTTIEQVAARAGLGKAAFLRRFGSKRQAVLILYDRYTGLCLAALDEMVLQIASSASPEAFLTDFYAATEGMHRAHFGLNLAMTQNFTEELVAVEGTKRVFRGFLSVMEQLQIRFLGREGICAEGQHAAAQLIISTSLNYALGAMPGMPRNLKSRHTLMGKIAWLALSHAETRATETCFEPPPKKSDIELTPEDRTVTEATI